MSRRSQITRLPPEELAELHQRLRDSQYRDLDAHLAWMAGKGRVISRSGLGRYVIRLRATDAAAGHEVASVALTVTSKQKTLRALLERLGRLEVERAALLNQVRVIGTVPPDE